jgi:hypothetical protein
MNPGRLAVVVTLAVIVICPEITAVIVNAVVRDASIVVELVVVVVVVYVDVYVPVVVVPAIVRRRAVTVGRSVAGINRGRYGGG